MNKLGTVPSPTAKLDYRIQYTQTFSIRNLAFFGVTRPLHHCTIASPWPPTDIFRSISNLPTFLSDFGHELADSTNWIQLVLNSRPSQDRTGQDKHGRPIKEYSWRNYFILQERNHLVGGWLILCKILQSAAAPCLLHISLCVIRRFGAV